MNFELQKRAAKINKILLDKGIKKAPVMRVAIALDISGSMAGIIESGTLQKAFNQMMGVSVKFDDNGELDVFKFDTRCDYVGTSKPLDGDFDRFIATNRIAPRGGTSYAPIVEAAHSFFFKKKMFGLGKVDKTPVLMLVLTDGEPSDAHETKRALEAAASDAIYFHFVAIGKGGKKSFPTISKLADDLPNVGEVYLDDLHVSDDEVYRQLICDELVGWIGGFTAQPATV